MDLMCSSYKAPKDSLLIFKGLICISGFFERVVELRFSSIDIIVDAKFEILLHLVLHLTRRKYYTLLHSVIVAEIKKRGKKPLNSYKVKSYQVIK